MKLLFDVGNSRVKWATADSQALQDTQSFEASVLSSDDGGSQLHDQFSEITAIDEIWISNVGSRSRLATLKAYLEERTEAPVQVVEVAESAFGMENAYLDIRQLGVDRWVAALGARALEPSGDLIVVDIGTAVTIDLVSAANRFEGGVILPGIKLMHEALRGGTAHVQVPISAQQEVVGRNTEQCVNAGIKFGLVGAIDGIVKTISQSRTDNDLIKVLLTGGGAPAVAAGLNFEYTMEPHLVLIGLLGLAGSR